MPATMLCAGGLPLNATIERSEYGRQQSVPFDAAEVLLSFQEHRACPALDHVALLPTLHVPAKIASRRDLVRETKGTRDFLKLRTVEADKVRCGQKHFEAIDVPFAVVVNAEEV